VLRPVGRMTRGARRNDSRLGDGSTLPASVLRRRSLRPRITRAKPHAPGRLRRTSATIARVPKEITQRQLRNDSGEIMRRLDAGESFVVTRNGVPVGELRPLHRHRFVAAEAALEAFGRAAPLDVNRFRADLDRFLDQDPAPRG
jgi:antitoxin (DNA-binding transcriptional repressor) of toxin-antitoxin stability system